MAAIRSAGGAGKAGLKKAAEEGGGGGKGGGGKGVGKGSEGAKGGGDLMGDLAAKLQLRRKGIAGPDKKESSWWCDVVLCRVMWCDVVGCDGV